MDFRNNWCRHWSYATHSLWKQIQHQFLGKFFSRQNYFEQIHHKFPPTVETFSFFSLPRLTPHLRSNPLLDSTISSSLTETESSPNPSLPLPSLSHPSLALVEVFFLFKEFSLKFPDGVLEGGFLEQCDYAITNSFCCTQDCQLRPTSYLCNATSPTDLCSSNSTEIPPTHFPQFPATVMPSLPLVHLSNKLRSAIALVLTMATTVLALDATF
jgi:hypothetical protein